MPEGPLSLRFPFDAVVGLGDAKRALLCLAADPRPSSVLIRGPSGTGKSVLARSLPDVSGGRRVVNVPAQITDEQLFGGIDFERAVSEGRAAASGGVLAGADGGIVMIDNVNLMDPRRLTALMDCLDTGEVIVEREGVSASYRCRASLVATMDPLEQDLKGGIADRFSICVSTAGPVSAEGRARIAVGSVEYRDDPAGFCGGFAGDTERTAGSVVSARSLLPRVEMPPDRVSDITGLCARLGVEGHRGDIAVARTATVLAALGGRTAVSERDVADAAVMCLAHRRAPPSEDGDCGYDEDDAEPDPADDYRKEVFDKRTIVCVDAEPGDPEDQDDGADDEPGTVEPPKGPTLVEEVMGRLEAIDDAESLRLHEIAGANARRRDIVSSDGWGRYSGSRVPDGRVTDPAFDATLRAAAPYQASRPSRGLSVTIEPQDIREKIRTRRDGCSFLFVVDLSGSAVNDRMIGHINRAIKAMLRDGYVNRDRVGLMTFNESSVHLPVPFTRAVETVCGELERSPAGGCTPLGLAMLEARAYMLNYVRKNPAERCYVMLMTDGETTKSVVPGFEATIELKKVAKVCTVPNTEWVVIDTKLGYSRRNNARRLAILLGSRYMTLDSLAEY